MSIQTGPRPTRTPSSYSSYEEERGQGWIAVDILAIYGVVAYGGRIDR
jgi:hypothetical protein